MSFQFRNFYLHRIHRRILSTHIFFQLHKTELSWNEECYQGLYWFTIKLRRLYCLLLLQSKFHRRAYKSPPHLFYKPHYFCSCLYVHEYETCCFYQNCMLWITTCWSFRTESQIWLKLRSIFKILRIISLLNFVMLITW